MLHNKVKHAGFKSVKELSAYIDVSERTLYNWSKSKPLLFDTVLIGAATRKMYEKRISFILH